MECSAVLCHFRGCQDASVCRQEGCFKHCLRCLNEFPLQGVSCVREGRRGEDELLHPTLL